MNRSVKEEPLTLRPSRLLWILMSGTSTVFLAVAVIAFKFNLEWWYRLILVVLLFLSPVGFAELATQRVELKRDELSLVKTFRRQTFARTEVEAVTWGKGVGVSIRLVDGTWIRLPQVGKSDQGVTNTIRAWIQRTSKLEQS